MTIQKVGFMEGRRDRSTRRKRVKGSVKKTTLPRWQEWDMAKNLIWRKDGGRAH